VRVLVHLGLNKCGSTYLQNALDLARSDLTAAGVWYPVEAGPPAQYALSKRYGFGPEAPEIAPRDAAAMVAEARCAGCDALILSSEYLSLYRPKAARALHRDLRAAGADVHYLMYSREVLGWVRSLFNQYVRTVEHGPYLPNVDAYVDQVLANRTVDIAARHRLWAEIAGPGRLTHVRIGTGAGQARLLDPFSAFAGIAVPAPEAGRAGNESVSPDALYQIGLLRRQTPCPARERALERLLAGGTADLRAPAGYAEIGPERRDRLTREVIATYAALPGIALCDRAALSDRLGTPAGAAPGARIAA